MDIGFIGAGKVGTSLGKYLTEHQIPVSGYYSKTASSAQDAATFTGTSVFKNLASLTSRSDAIFITVPDGAIANVWEQLKALSLTNKLICHFSGSMTSDVFTDIESYGAYGYSMHPLYAIHDKFDSYQHLGEAFFTVEGHERFQAEVVQLFKELGNAVTLIQKEDKMRYHAAAAVVSNLYVGVVSLGEKMLVDCGFTSEEAHEALKPLIRGNTENILKHGPTDALTGPIERNDSLTVKNHLNTLTDEEKTVYQVLSKLVLELAEKKHPTRDFQEIRGLLEK